MRESKSDEGGKQCQHHKNGKINKDTDLCKCVSLCVCVCVEVMIRVGCVVKVSSQQKNAVYSLPVVSSVCVCSLLSLYCAYTVCVWVSDVLLVNIPLCLCVCVCVCVCV